MVAVVENVDRLGRRSGLISASTGLIIAYVICAINWRGSQYGIWARLIQFMLSRDKEVIITIIASAVVVVLSSWLSGAFVGQKALISFPRAAAWSVVTAYVDLLVGLTVAFLVDSWIIPYLGSGVRLMPIEYFVLVGFSSICAFLPIVIVSTIRALWLRKSFDHERVLW